MLQIRNKNDDIVYAERLTKEQIWGLPKRKEDALAAAPPLADSDHDARAPFSWANPTESPYKVIVYLAKGDVAAWNVGQIQGTPALNQNPANVEKKYSDYSGTVLNYVINSLTQGEEGKTSVLIHSMDILRAPWDPMETFNQDTDIPAAGEEREKWIRWKLNYLGYYGGPFNTQVQLLQSDLFGSEDQEILDYQKKALIHFRSNHGDLARYYYEHYGEKLPSMSYNTVLGKLKESDDQIPYFTKPDDDTRILIDEGESLKLENRNDKLRICLEPVSPMAKILGPAPPNLVQAPVNDGGPPMDQRREEFMAQNNPGTTKKEIETERVNRPLIPIEVKLYLKSKDGATGKQWVPEAVGSVKVHWTHSEPQEDLNDQFEEEKYRSYPRRYVERCLKLRDGRNGDKINNCNFRYGGVRRDETVNYLMPFLEKTYYLPYDARDSGESIFSTAYDGRQVGGITYSKRIGKAGVYFRPSYIAGDAYRIKAKIDKANLDPKQLAVDVETNTIEIWRYKRLAAVLSWPARDLDEVLEKMKKEYAAAYFDFDTDSYQSVSMDTFIDQKTFDDWWKANTKNVAYYQDSMVEEDINTTLSPIAMFRLRDGYNKATALNWAIAYSSPEVFETFWGSIFVECRKRFKGGTIVVDFKPLDQALQGYPNIGESGALANGAVVINATSPGDATYYIYSHEIGHSLWLQHGINTTGWQPALEEHDPTDQNCIMDYGHLPQKPTKENPHRTAKKYRPHFCGKCNLKLRGWNVRHKDILQLDQAERDKVPNGEKRFVLYYDKEDTVLANKYQEIATIKGIFNSVFVGRFYEKYFQGNTIQPDFATWINDIHECDIYHNITHGNIRCSSHRARVPVWEDRYCRPRYPVWCWHGLFRNVNKKLIKKLNNGLTTLFLDLQARRDTYTAELNNYISNNLINHRARKHRLRGVIQWTIDDNDSSQDVEFTYEQIKWAIDQGFKPPKILAFFGSCMIGWDHNFSKLFIDNGTQYVIAFRTTAENVMAKVFAEVFYKEWAKDRMAADKVEDCFLKAAKEMPFPLPVLFSQGGIIQTYAKFGPNSSRRPEQPEDNVVIQRLLWTDLDEFYKPHMALFY